MIQLIRKHSSASNDASLETDATLASDTGAQQSSMSKNPKQQLTVATFEKWQRNYERGYQTLSWL